jgi:hypothetical protein
MLTRGQPSLVSSTICSERPGGATIAALPGVKVTPYGVMTIINGALPQPRGVASVEIGSPSRPQSEVWSSRVGRHQSGYMVMLFADPADGR